MGGAEKVYACDVMITETKGNKEKDIFGLIHIIII